MTDGETKYQRYLARKRQKQAEKTGQANSGQAPGQATPTANAPIHECLVPAGLFEKGLGNLVFSRTLENGHIALSVFLVDAFCLGVKNAFFTIVTRHEYAMRVRNWSSAEGLQPIKPECFRKLVEGAVAYARELGFRPHADYAEASQIFGNVEAATCSEQFEYGHNGKPFYMSGPNETRSQARNIVKQLERQFGPDGFEFIMME
jgi:hypothetical protein